MSDLNTILADMQAASDAADETSEPTDYTMRLVALALIARHYLRVLASQSAPQEPLNIIDDRPMGDYDAEAGAEELRPHADLVINVKPPAPQEDK